MCRSYNIDRNTKYGGAMVWVWVITSRNCAIHPVRGFSNYYQEKQCGGKFTFQYWKLKHVLKNKKKKAMFQFNSNVAGKCWRILHQFIKFVFTVANYMIVNVFILCYEGSCLFEWWLCNLNCIHYKIFYVIRRKLQLEHSFEVASQNSACLTY